MTEPTHCNYGSPCTERLRSTAREATAMGSLCTATKNSPYCNERKPSRSNADPAQWKINKLKKKKKRGGSKQQKKCESHHTRKAIQNYHHQWEGDFCAGTADGSPPANAGDTGSIPGLGRFHNYWSPQAVEPTTEKSPRETVQRIRPSKITSFNTAESWF